jgi:hypothetical protein
MRLEAWTGSARRAWLVKMPEAAAAERAAVVFTKERREIGASVRREGFFMSLVIVSHGVDRAIGGMGSEV